MTDKQIIIDGVKVEECSYYNKDNIPYCCEIWDNECEAQNCYYKQLKRKGEKLDKIKTICEKETTKSTFCNGIENKDSQKLAIKILKIIIGGKNNG